ncbi:hypothetical protein VTN00DRAFT_5918 [Thermoascus crustaceus]|uniref:uncharacterized protein n=1 Tax=Thermoascus crustaceus TaxID=5088 RepID=UPI003743186D
MLNAQRDPSPLLFTAPDWRSMAKEIRASWRLAQTLRDPGNVSCYQRSFRTEALTSSTRRQEMESVGREQSKQNEWHQVWTRIDSPAIFVRCRKPRRRFGPPSLLNGLHLLQIVSNPKPLELVSDEVLQNYCMNGEHDLLVEFTCGVDPTVFSTPDCGVRNKQLNVLSQLRPADRHSHYIPSRPWHDAAAMIVKEAFQLLDKS